MVADVVTVARIERDVREFQAAAANVYKLPSNGQVDGRGCDALWGTSTIQASGAMREMAPITVEEAPLVPMTAYEVSLGFGAIIGIENQQLGGVWMEAGLAQLLGIGPGGALTTKNGPLPVAAVYDWPNDGRDIRFGFAILVPVAADRLFDECWIRAWPLVDENEKLLRSTLVVTSESYPVLIGQVNRNFGVSMDANQLYVERITWHIIWVGPLVLALIGFVATWRRRLEYSAALHAGQGRGAFMLGVVIETGVWVIFGTVLALMVSLVVIRVIGLNETWPVWLSGAIVAWWVVVGALLGAVGAAVMIREKGLFQFFKTR
jgi:hypothetical protein